MDEFQSIFDALKAILQPFEPYLVVTCDSPTDYYLDTAHICKNKKPMFFGAVTQKKSYVSFHLMPIYVFPELREAESDALKARSQGKSCFNFKRVEPELFGELKHLTAAGFERFKSEGLLN